MIHATGASVSIRLFGHADVSVAGAPVKFAKRATTLAMLALVILRRGAPISRESLAYTLFPEADESSALADLRRYLYLASKALPSREDEPWLIVDADTVRWNDASGAFVDVVAFESLAADPHTQAAAIDLYAGDLLEDVYDDWVVAERERLRNRYLAILGESLERARAARDFPAAIAHAKRVLAADPWREDTLRALVAIRYESGDTAGALAEYENFSKRLRDELGVAPMPETVAVRASILRNDTVPGSVPRAAAAQPNAAPHTDAMLPFVGRKYELSALRAAWGRAARGAGNLVLLSGEAGVGKSRLTAELARIAQAEGGRVFAGTTGAPESMPYQALIEALRSALPLILARPPAPARRDALARLLPELHDPASMQAELPELSPERATSRLYDALIHVVRGLAAPRPLLLILEDLHWAGPASVDALGALVRDVGNAPVLIVATCRDEETPVDHPLRALQRALRTHRNVEEVALERLGEPEVAELVARVDGLRESAATLAQQLFAYSEGNALFLSEAIGGMLDDPCATFDVPAASVAGLIGARVARLNDDARAVAEIAAVAGPGCNVALVREVSNLPAAAVARGLDELLDRRILREAGVRASYDYAFTHHLIAAAIYGEIEAGFRAQRHSRIARILERTSAAPREIARHFEAAGDGAMASGWYLSAARQAAAVHAYGDASELAGRALEHASSEELRAEALGVRETARGRSGDRSGQRADIDALERLAGGDPHRRFDALGRRVLLERSLGESSDEGRAVAALELLASELDEAARAHALLQRAIHAGLRSRPAEGIGPARESLAIYEGLGDGRGQLECLFQLVDFTTNTGDLEASRRYLALMHERAGGLNDRVVEARALSVAATAALLRQEYRECFALTTRSLELQLATNDREGEAGSHGRLAACAARFPDFATALREFELAARSYEAIGNKRGVAITSTNRAMLLIRLGRFAEALASIERSNELFDVVSERRTIAANKVNASFIKLQLGDAEAARELARSALDDATAIGFPVFEAAALANLGNAERALGDFDAALEHMEAGIALRRPLQEAPDFADDLADLILAYADAGRGPQAMATAEELAEIGRGGFDNSLWPHYIWWTMARGYAAGGDAERARSAETFAREALMQFASCIEDARMRAGFLALPISTRIAAGGIVDIAAAGADAARNRRA